VTYHLHRSSPTPEAEKAPGARSRSNGLGLYHVDFFPNQNDPGSVRGINEKKLKEI
jgi:hypothetical protein